MGRYFKYILLGIVVVSSCELDYFKKNRFDKYCKNFYELKLPATYSDNFLQQIDYKEIVEEKFIAEFLENKDVTNNFSAKYKGGEQYNLNEEIKILLWSVNFNNNKILQIGIFQNGELLDSYVLAGELLHNKISCEISKDFKIKIKTVEEIDNGIEKTTIKELQITENGAIKELNSEEITSSMNNISDIFTETKFPYSSTNLIEKEQLQELSPDELEYFMNFSLEEDFFDPNYTYFPFKFIQISEDAKAYTFLAIPKNDLNEKFYKHERIFFENNGNIVSFYELWSQNTQTKTDAKILENNNKLFIQYEMTEFSQKNNILRESYFMIDVYKLKDDYTKRILSGLNEAYPQKSFSGFLNNSKIKSKLDIETYKIYGKLNQKMTPNAYMESVAYFKFEDQNHGFIYHIEDEKYNIYLYNKFSESGELFDYKILDQTLKNKQSDCSVEKLYYENKPIYNIVNRYSDENYVKNTYIIPQEETIRTFSASQKNYKKCDSLLYCSYFYTLIDDEKLNYINKNLNAGKIIDELKKTETMNEVIKYNIRRLKTL